MVSDFSWCACRNRAWFRAAAVAVVGLALAACGQAVKPSPKAELKPEPELHLSRAVAAGVAASKQVDDALASSLRALGNPLGGLQDGQIGAVASAEAPNLAGCAPMLNPGADSDGDGYPADEANLDLDCMVLLFHLGGTLVLEDKDDMDRESGFRSEVDLRMTFAVEDHRLELAAIQQDLDVDAREDGAGYRLSYSGAFKLPVAEEPFLESEVRFTYAGTLQGTYGSGRLTVDAAGGTYSFATVPIDCAKLTGEEEHACRRQAPDDPGTSFPPLAVHSSGIAFDKANCDTLLTGGHFDVQDDSGNVLRINYGGCGERSATYNGETIPIPPPAE